MALLEDGVVVELGVEHRSDQSVLHGIYRGRVQRVVPSTQAAFLDIGLHRNAFLQIDQIPRGTVDVWREEGRTPDAEKGGAANGSGESSLRIENMLRAGQPVLVQVVREPLGPKGYKVSCDLNLQGRFFDFRPLASTGIITSRATAGPREQLRIAALVERRSTLKGEWVARSTAEQRDEETLAADITRLEADWVEVRKESLSGPPACLRADVPMVFRYIRDVLSSGFSVIRVDSETLYGRMVNFIRQFLPGMEHKVRLYSRNYPILEEYGVEVAFEQAARRRVRLPSGGSIIIDQTEALVAVDVNTGSFTGDTGERDETNTVTNLEAAVETARQLRLRGLGGIIVIDFIDMKEGRNRDRVFRTLQAELRRDPAFTRVAPPESRAGLVIVTRKRERPSLESALLASCPACRGSGRVRSLGAVCQDVLVRAQKKSAEFTSGLVVRASPSVASALRRSAVLSEIRTVVAGPVTIEEAPALPEPQFELVTGTTAPADADPRSGAPHEFMADPAIPEASLESA
ncbi:MAG: Rne/Rng family ribonuclease [Acidobacteria bacterium]|nr:Rne/Rng family ribonuclease [Acidobacteriota bacterium]